MSQAWLIIIICSYICISTSLLCDKSGEPANNEVYVW